MELNKFYFYTLLSQDAQALVLENMKPFAKKKGDILYYAGDVCEDFVIIDTGTIRVYVQGESSQTLTLYTVEDGEPCIINTFSTIFSNVTVANAEVVKDLEGWMLNKDILLNLLKTESEFSAYLFQTVSHNIAALVGTVTDVKFSSINERLQDWIISKNKTTINTTHEEIATHIGTTRPIISKLLKDMENEKKLVLKRGSIEIIDLQKEPLAKDGPISRLLSKFTK